MAVLFESEGLLTVPCQAPGLLETSLSSSGLYSLPGADITQAACGECWLRGQRPKCAHCGVWHHPAASARTPCLCQRQMQRLRPYRQLQPGPRVPNCASQRRESVMMPRGQLGIPGTQANCGCHGFPWKMETAGTLVPEAAACVYL